MPQNLGANHPLQTPSTTTTLSSSAGPVNISFSFINDADVLVFLGGTLRTNSSTGNENYTINSAKTQITFNSAVSGAVIITRKSDLLNKVRTFTAGSSVRAADLNTQFDQVMQLIQDNYELLRGVILNDGNDEITAGRDSTIANDKVRTESIQDNAVTLTKIAAGNANQVLITSGGEPTWSDNVDVQGTLDVTGTTTLDGALNVAGNADLNGTLDVDGNTELDDVNVSGTLDVAGNSTFDGNVDLGNAATDTITINGEVDSNIVPEADGTRSLGSTTKRWHTVHADNIEATTLRGGNGGASVAEADHATHVVNDTTYFTTAAAEARFWRQDTGGSETITGTGWTAADNRVATTRAIDNRIVNLVTEVGGFVPIANETSFPATNPDINDGAGTIVSIGALDNNLVFDANGEVTIANGAGQGNTVTITGGPQSTTIASNSGALVETSAVLHTYTWHRTTPDGANVNTVANAIANVNTVAGSIANVNTVGGDIANVNTVAGDIANVNTVAGISANVTTVANNDANITTVANDLNETTSEIDTVATNIANVNAVGNDIANVNTVAGNLAGVNSFAARYRAPQDNANEYTTSLDVGDLYFNTDSNALKVYNGSSWQTGVTTTTGFLATSGGQMTGNITFSGTETVDGRDISADGTKLDNIAANANNYTHPNHSGDVTSTGDGATTIANDAVTYAKMQNVSATNRILGRDSAGAGDVEEITPANLRTMINVADGANAYSHPNHSGDVTSTGDGATTIANDAVTYAKMQNVSATNRILGRDSAGAGDVEEITPANVRTMLNVADGANAYSHPNHSGDVTSTGDGATTIANDAVTYAKMQNVVTANRVLGSTSAGGIVTELQISEALLNCSNDPTDGHVLTARSGNTGGLTWEEASATGGATGGGTDQIFNENGTTVTTDYIVGTTLGATNACNAMSAGPITVNSGVTVTVNSGSRWVIV